ncbi:MAG: HAD family hydrolase [Clostridiales bacterium]|nr:HAD family hydrolase [Clostridiales bacterium]
MFDYILFDLDGTLTDSFDGVGNSILYAMKKLGRTLPDKQSLRWCLGPPIKESFLKLVDGDEKAANEGVRLYREYYSDRGLFENRVYDGIPEVLSELQDMGKRLIVATSKPEVFSKRILEKFKLSQYFNFVAAASLDSSRTQKYQVIDYAITEKRLTISKTVMVGDRHHDIDGANMYGIKSIGVLYGYGTEEELESAGADFIAPTPNDIVEIIRNCE